MSHSSSLPRQDMALRGRGSRWRWCIGGLFLAFLVSGFLVWRWRWPGKREDEVWARIQRTGVMRVGMDASFPPFEFVNEAGEFSGYDVDLARELARRFGVPQVVFVDISFDGLYDALAEARCDLLISALPYDRDLTQDVVYSRPYFDAGQMLLVREEENGISGTSDLAGKRVAVELGSEGHYIVRELQLRKGIHMELLTPYTPAEALDLLRDRKADAAIVEAISAHTYMGQHRGLKAVGGQLTAEPYVIAMPLDSPRLSAEVNKALQAMMEEGYLHELQARWLGSD